MTYNENRKRSTLKYLAKQKTIHFYVKPELFSEYVAAMDALDYTSMREFVMASIDEKMKTGMKKGEYAGYLKKLNDLGYSSFQEMIDDALGKSK